MATHSSILVWKIPWTEEPGVLHVYSQWGCKESDTTEHTLTPTHSHTSIPNSLTIPPPMLTLWWPSICSLKKKS